MKKARSKNWSEDQTILLKGNDVNCAIEDETLLECPINFAKNFSD